MLAKQKERLRDLSSTNLKKLVHDLGTHQIELEMQNEELRRAQAEIESSRRKYADLYNFSPVGYFTFDKNGLILEVNHNGAGMIGREKRLLIARPIQNFIEPNGRAVFRDHLIEVFRTTTRQTCEINLRRKDGVLFPAQLQSIVADSGEETTGSCRTAVSDISERVQAEEEVRRLNKDLQNSLLELKAINIELDSFSYSVSNGLRSPLRSIDGFTNAILDDCAPVLGDTCRDYLNRVISASRRMSQLIDALLNMARLTKGELRERSVDLSGLAGVIIHDLRRKHPERQVEAIIAPELKVLGDRDMLRTVLENLLDNAWKFTSKRPVTKIEFGATENDGRMIYFVRDNGAGFDMQYVDKLFQPFKRMHSESEFAGLDMGLAIAQSIIMRHSGRIWAEGEVGKGATLYFTL